MTRSTSKYGNIRCKAGDGRDFDSRKERRRYSQLLLLKHAGEISDFQCQVPYLLREGFRYGGKAVRKEEYVADFVIRYPDGRVDIEDVKSEYSRKDRLWRSKWNRMKYLFRNDPKVRLVENV